MPYLTRDGVKLYYEEAGAPSADQPALVFVHGWCCNHTHFAPQFEHFKASHRVVSVDLRGHGNSDKPLEDYTMPLFADDVAFQCGELGIDKAVAIGHSMGGSVVATLASRHPQLVRAGVAIDSPLITTEGARQRLSPRIEALGRSTYLETAREIVDSMFLPGDDSERRRVIRDGMLAAPQHTMESSMRLILSQSRAALGVLHQPVLLISAGWVPFDLGVIREAIPNIRYAQTYGSGHFCMLEVPDQVNAMIERFLALEVAKPSAELAKP